MIGVLLLLDGIGGAVASAGTVWTNFPPAVSPVANLSDALVSPDVLGVRVLSGTVSFGSGNTYSGGTELQGGTINVSAASPFGSTAGAVSLKGGLIRFDLATTVGNPLTLDGPYSFGYNGGSSFDNVMAFSQPLTLNGNYVLTHIGNNGGQSWRPVHFNGGVGDGGNGYHLTVAYTAYNNGAFRLGSGSTYTGTTVVHGATLQLYGTLTTTAGIQANRGGNFQMFWDSAGTDNRLGNAVPVFMRGGQMQANIYSGGTDFDTTETVGNVRLEYAHSTLSIYAVRAHGTMTITNLTRASGATAYFSRSGASQNNASSGYGYGRLKITGQPAGFMGGWAVARRDEYVGGVLQDSGYDFAWYDTSTAVLSGVLPMETRTTRVGQVEGATAADHVKTTSAQTTLTAGAALQSLCVTNGLNNDLGGYALDIVSGGLLNRGGAYTLSNGSLTSSGGSLYLFNYGSSMMVGATITGGAVSVSTAGSQTLSGNNLFGGSLYVNSGTLTLTGSNTGVAETTVAPGATLSVQHPEAITRPVRLNLLFDGEDRGKCSLGTNITVLVLDLGGESLPKGEYTAVTHPQYLSGTGSIKVIPPPRGTVVTFR